MSRLIVQAPDLPDHHVDAFSALIGCPPQQRAAQLAQWSQVSVPTDQFSLLADQLQVDAEIVPDQDQLNNYRLLAFDMDSTLITVECIDEIAEFAGKKAEVSAITEAAMRGELDFRGALNRRLALLAGLDISILQRVYDERIRTSPGARALIAAAHQAGLKTAIVSGGFTWFTERLANELGMHMQKANELEVSGGRLTGRVVGAIVDAQKKQDTVVEYCSQLGCAPSAAIVIGDGANDLRMMAIAGISVAYRAKPIVRSETKHAINHCGLDSILNYFS